MHGAIQGILVKKREALYISLEATRAASILFLRTKTANDPKYIQNNPFCSTAQLSVAAACMALVEIAEGRYTSSTVYLVISSFK